MIMILMNAAIAIIPISIFLAIGPKIWREYMDQIRDYNYNLSDRTNELTFRYERERDARKEVKFHMAEILKEKEQFKIRVRAKIVFIKTQLAQLEKELETENDQPKVFSVNSIDTQ